MKKLFALAAVAAAMSLGACTNNAKTAEENLDFENATPETVVNTLVEKVQAGDATAVVEAVETIQAELKDALDNGDVEKATEYASKIQAFVTENADKLKELNVNTVTLNDIINAVKNLPTTAEGVAEDAAAAVEADAEAVKDAAKAQADAAVEDAKAKANEAVEDAKAKANEAVQDAKAKANEAVQDAADKANKAANDAINDAASKLKL